MGLINMIKRPLVFLIFFFILGIIAVNINTNFIYVAVAAMLLATFILFYKPRYMSLLLIAIVSFSIGAARYKIAEISRENIIKKYDGCSVNTEILALSFSLNNSFPAEITIENEKVKAYVYIEECSVEPGDILKGELLLSAPKNDRNSRDDFATYLSGRNIYLSAYGEELHVIDKKAPFIKGSMLKLRKNLGKLSEEFFSGNSRALFSAMVLGDKRYFTDELSTLLQRAGQNHIAVVSGMHLSIISGVLMMLIGMFFGKKRIGNFLAIGIVIFMTVITGAGASVVRSCIMCVLFHVAKLVRRETDSLTSLFIAAFVMIMYNPYIINNVGFVLSLWSVLGIILYAEKFTNMFKKFMPKTLAEATGVCLGAQMTVTPFVLYYFGTIAPYAILANLLIFMLASMMVVVGMMFVVFSGVWGIGTVLASIIKALSVAIISVCRFIEMLPFSLIKTGSISITALIFYASILILIYFYPRYKKITFKICIAAAVIVICSLAVSAGRVGVHVLNYSTENNLFVKAGDKAVFVGCTESDDVLSLIDRYCANKEIYVVATNSDAREIAYLLQSGKTMKVILPEGVLSESDVEKIKIAAKETIFLNDEEEYFIDSISVSYISASQIKENKIIKLSTQKESVITMQSLKSHDISLLYKNGESFNATYFISPPAFDKTKELISYMVSEESIVKDRQIFLKR